MQDREIVWEAELRGMTPEAVFAEYVSLTPLGRIEEPEDVADVVALPRLRRRPLHDRARHQRDRRREDGLMPDASRSAWPGTRS